MHTPFFAQDPLDKNFCSQVLHRYVDAASQQRKFSLLALINGAARADCLTWLQAQGMGPLPVFDESPYRAMAFAGPLLLPLAPTLEAVEPLAHLFNGIPALSFMATGSALWAVQAHLAQVLEVSLLDEPDDRYLLNLADTRCLPDILPLLQTPQGPGLSPGASWLWYPSREGHCLSYQDGAQHQDAAQSSTGLRLSAAQWQALIDSGDADAVLEQIHASEPELVQGRTGASLHALASEQIARLRAEGHDDMPTFVAACKTTLSLLTP